MDIWNQTSVIRCLTSDITHSTSDIRRLMSDVRHLMFHILSDKFLPMYLSDVFVIFDVLPSICTFYHVLPCCFCHVLLVYRVMSWMFLYYHVNVSPRFTTFYPSRNGYKLMLMPCCILLSNFLSDVLYTAISRKVVGKNMHATIPKGYMGYHQYTVPDTVAVEPTFVAFL